MRRKELRREITLSHNEWYSTQSAKILSVTVLMLTMSCAVAGAYELPMLVLIRLAPRLDYTEVGDGLPNIVIREALKRSGLRFKVMRLPGL